MEEYFFTIILLFTPCLRRDILKTLSKGQLGRISLNICYIFVFLNIKGIAEGVLIWFLLQLHSVSKAFHYLHKTTTKSTEIRIFGGRCCQDADPSLSHCKISMYTGNLECLFEIINEIRDILK